MKIEKETIQYIKQVVKTAKLLNMDSICIEHDIVRAMSEDRTVFLIQTENIPAFPFDAIGIARIPEFLNRLEMVQDRPGFKADGTDDNGSIRSLKLKCTGTSVGFNCTDPGLIRAPRKLNNITPQFQLDITDDTIDILKKGESAMKSDKITITGIEGKVTCEINDVNNDVFKHTLPSDLIILDEEAETFTHRYPSKLLITLLNSIGATTITIRNQGILSMTINGLEVFMPPKV